MHRPRVRLGLEASRATLDTARAAQLGQKARAARTERALDIAAVGKTLMLSPAQIRALEDVTPDAFYGAEFYVNALKKYLAYLGLNPADAADVLVAATAPATAPAAQLSQKASGDSVAWFRSRAAVATLASAVIAGTAGAGWYVLSQQPPTAVVASADSGASQSPAAAAPPAVPTPVPPAGSSGLTPTASTPDPVVDTTSGAAVAVPVPAPETIPVSTEVDDSPVDHGGVTVRSATWVFVRYEDNATDERRVGAGETFVFRRHPIFIAVGQVEGTVIHVNGERIDAKPHVTNGQIRIGRDVLGTPLAGG